MRDIQWMNDLAQTAKWRGDYHTFEFWRRNYLNAQAAIYQRKHKKCQPLGSDFTLRRSVTAR